jgi:DNA-binding FadR family transcriptional regulator
MENNLKLTPPQKVTVVEAIIEQIVSKIGDGELKQGDKLPSERQMIDMLGVSRSSVREALQGLAAMGLAETRSGDGTFIKQRRASFDLYGSNLQQVNEALQKEMRHSLCEARLILERGIVTFAAENIDPQSKHIILEAWHTLSDFENKAIEDPNYMNWHVHDQFHISIADASGNPFLVHLLKTLLDSVPESLRDRNLLFGDKEITRVVFMANRLIHENLCKAVMRSDAPAARKWIQHHSDFEEINIDYAYGDQSSSDKRQKFEKFLQMLKEAVD